MKNQKRKKKNVFKIFSIIFIIFIIIGMGIWGALFAANNILKEDKKDNDNDDEGLLNTPKKEEVTFLAVGMNEMLTDTIIFGKYNTVENRLYLMSIPRDTYTTNPYCIGHKLNALYREENLDEFLTEIEEMLDVSIDYYAIFRAKFVHQVVDAVGGVEINVPQRMYYVDKSQDLVIDLQPGVQVLNGKKAEQYLRFRSGYSNADLGRVEAQRTFIKAFIQTAIKPENIKNAPSIIKTAVSNMTTNATVRELLKYSDEIKEMNLDDIVSITMPNAPKYIDNISYVVANKTEARRVIKEDWKKQEQTSPGTTGTTDNNQ